MATHRYISTTFWDDAWIQELDPSEKFVYLYLMTNPLTSISGVYKITDRRIGFDTGYDIATIKTIMEKFTATNKAVRYGEWVIIPSWPKHQSWDGKDDIKLGIISELQELPEDVFEFLNEVDYKFPLDDVKNTPIVRKLRKGIPGSAWKQAIEKSGGKCVVCGSEKNIVVRRIIPVEEGGNNTVKNLEAVCHTCYSSKRTIPNAPVENSDNPHTPCGVPHTPVENSDNPQLLNSILLNSDSIQSEFNINFSGNSIADTNSPQSEKPVDNSPPPNFYEIIKEKVRTAGFYIDDPVVRKIAKAIPYPIWITDRHSIIDFVKKKIEEDPKYSPKPLDERKRLFISALTTWKNIPDEYQDWLNKQINIERQKAEQEALERLRRSPPANCPHCGTSLENTRVCPKCDGSIFFDEEKKAWEYQEPFDFKTGFNEIMNRMNRPKKEPSEPEDIDF